MVHDETRLVISKARSKDPRSLSEPLLPTQSNFSNSSYETSRAHLAAGVHIYLDSVAINYFMDNYIADTAFFYLHNHWTLISDNDLIRAAISPVAIAALAQTSKHFELQSLSRTKYGNALSVINQALSQTSAVTSDALVLSILLLAMYEALTFRGRMRPDRWIAHINGLTAVLKGRENLGPKLSQTINQHAVNQILIHCAVQLRLVSPEIRSMHQRQTYLTQAPPSVFGILVEDVIRLRKGMGGMLASEIVRECLRLDKLTQQDMEVMFKSSPYVTTSLNESSTLKCQVHTYQSQNAARQWNNLRTIRIVLNDWIFSSCTSLQAKSANQPIPNDQLHVSWDRVSKTAKGKHDHGLNDLLGSIPYSRGCIDMKSDFGARFLLWPLSVAGSSKLCPPEVRAIIIKQLKTIAEVHGIEQATEAATMLEEGVDIEKW